MPKPTTHKTVQRKPANRDPASTKLTDAQRTILSGAASRDDGAATLPEGMTERAAQKLATILIEKGLVREVRGKTDMPVWRRNDEGRASALIITKLGRDVVKGDAGKPDDAGAKTPRVPPSRTRRRLRARRPPSLTEASRVRAANSPR